MRRIAIAGTVALALTFGACAAKQPPAPPPLNLVTEAEPKAAPAPPSPEEILAAQPPEVQQAIKEHDKSGDWPIYKTPAYTLYPYNERPSAHGRLRAATNFRHSAAAKGEDHRPCDR
jgi:hypothetical protein